MQQVALILLLVACGGPSPPPAKPKDDISPTPSQLAHDIDEDMAMLARIAHDGRGKCEATIAELRAHISRMQVHHEQAMVMTRDQAKRATLVAEMDRYGKLSTGRGADVGADLAFTHHACAAACKPDENCATTYQLERVIGDIPLY